MFVARNIPFEFNSRKSFERTEEGLRISVRGGRRMQPRCLRKLTWAVFKMTLRCMYIGHGP